MNEVLNEALVEVLRIVLGLAVSAIGVYAAQAVKQLRENAKKKGVLQDIENTLKELENNKEIVGVVVRFIEQAYGDLENSGKLEKAKEYALDWINKSGLTISESALDALIESSVKELKDSYKAEKASLNQ